MEQGWLLQWVKQVCMSADLVAAQSAELISVLEQLPEGVFVVDADSRVVFANKPGMRLVKLKPKKTLGVTFPFDIEDGPMRDFDVEMTVKGITWGGRDASLIHLKSLKSAGAFHLEWKLEAALEKARSVEILLDELKSREGMDAVPSAPEANPELETELQIQRDKLALARERETALSEKIAVHDSVLEEQRREFEDRLAELESLLELAETRADEIQSDIAIDDHQAVTELQNAVKQAREAEEQIRHLELELEQARDRIRVAEEQAEVAEERAYTLETEVSNLGSQEDWDAKELEWQDKLKEIEEESFAWKTQAEELTTEVEKLQQELAETTQLHGDYQVQATTDLEERSSEIEALQATISTQNELNTALTGDLEAREQKIVELETRIEEKNSELEAKFGDSDSRALELSKVRDELAEAKQELAEEATKLAAASLANAEITAKLESLTYDLKVRAEESDELAEQLRVETEQFEESTEQLRAENEQLTETLREQTEELESLREIASDAESLVEEFTELKCANEELSSQAEEFESTQRELERVKKELQKLENHLEEAQAQAQKGDKVDKLGRKLEGALRRAEEAEERLQEERRLLNELRETSEQRISELEERGAVTSDPSQAESVNPETERLAFQDSLTGLPNRNILHRYLGFMLKQATRYERYTALLRIDCDRFKSISDTFGEEVGDRLIRLVGERLSAVVRNADVLGRFGEDEFVILLSELTDQKEASVVTASVIKRIYQMLRKPFSVEEQSISVEVSIGVSLYPLDAANGEQMFQHSAEALKRAKENGRGQAQYYTPEVQASHVARNTRDAELKVGLERGEFGLLYQPIFDLSNGQVVGVEALIRWNHPRLGSIGPDEFLKVAEESGIIVLIGNWALRSALHKAAEWQQQGLGLFVSLNLSRRQLLQADLMPTIHTALTEYRCSPDRVLLEITEELTGPELARLDDTLQSLQQLGVRLAVDNFGTSASSLKELRRGPFKVLKIDRRFVRGVPENTENAGIVLSALTLGHHLERITVAVGVETETERAWLAKMGCRFAQGNLLSEPLSPELVSEIVKRR